MKQRPLQLLLTFKHKHFFSIDDFISNSADTRIYSELFPITKGLILNNSDKKKKTKLSGMAEGANKTTVTASAETLTITIN